MNERNKFESWQKDYRAFMSSGEVMPSESVSARLIDRVQKELNPRPWTVFKKLFLVHLLSGGLTLLVCPQLGIGPIGGGHGLMGFVMSFGPWACALFCGSFFMGTTALASLLVLSPEEARVIRRHQLWQFSVLVIFSFLALMSLGRALERAVPHSSPEYLLLWITAGILFPQMLYQVFYRLRFRRLKTL